MRHASRICMLAIGSVVIGVLISAREFSLFDGPAHAAEQSKDLQIQQLQEQIKSLQGLVPDQAAVMTHVAYHFSNLFFAIEQENWPLADFYLGEARNNVKWAVRAKPIRKD